MTLPGLTGDLWLCLSTSQALEELQGSLGPTLANKGRPYGTLCVSQQDRSCLTVPTASGRSSWHSETRYFPPEDTETVELWLLLQPSSQDGCFFLTPF